MSPQLEAEATIADRIYKAWHSWTQIRAQATQRGIQLQCRLRLVEAVPSVYVDYIDVVDLQSFDPVLLLNKMNVLPPTVIGHTTSAQVCFANLEKVLKMCYTYSNKIRWGVRYSRDMKTIWLRTPDFVADRRGRGRRDPLAGEVPTSRMAT